jgi:hypothetical protein
MSTLLEKAKRAAPGVRRRGTVTQEQLDLALAYVKDEIDTRQFCSALNLAKFPSNAHQKCFQILRDAILVGWLDKTGKR